MLSANGFRLFRVTVTKAKITKKPDPAAYVRQTAKRKGLVLDIDGRNPSMPFRYREVSKGVIEIDQMQIVTGTHAIAPPEQEDFVERFMAGETWLGTVKAVTVP